MVAKLKNVFTSLNFRAENFHSRFAFSRPKNCQKYNKLQDYRMQCKIYCLKGLYICYIASCEMTPEHMASLISVISSSEDE